MGYAVLSDVHSNMEALNAVIEDLKDRGIHDLYFLGDAVGYGPDPDECVELLNAECKIMIAGNHDLALAALSDLSRFNRNARTALEWTGKIMHQKNIMMLSKLPVRADIRSRNISIVHSSPYEPEQWHYLTRLNDAQMNFQHFDTEICFIGHSHSPVIIEKLPGGEIITHRDDISLRRENRYIINAGSVGQPRDGNPKAGYVLVADEKIKIIRVSYDIRATQEKMRKMGLPIALTERLAFGV